MEKRNKCSLCRNHHGNQAENIKNHKCPYKKDDHIKICQLCKIVYDRQKLSAEKKKQSYHRRKNNNDAKCINVSSTGRKLPTCLKCADHGFLDVFLKNKHKEKCPFIICNCDYCKLTDFKRKICNTDTKNYLAIKRKNNPASLKVSNTETNSVENQEINQEQQIKEQKCPQPLSTKIMIYAVESDGISFALTMHDEPMILSQSFDGNENETNENSDSGDGEIKNNGIDNFQSVNYDLKINKDFEDIFKEVTLETAEDHPFFNNLLDACDVSEASEMDLVEIIADDDRVSVFISVFFMIIGSKNLNFFWI